MTGRTAPDGFLWGTAISAHQSEGGNTNSDSWLLEHMTPSAYAEPAHDACDAYHHYGEDIALAASLGFNCYRFGIEWARIEPEPGFFSNAALGHYRRMLETCHAHGLQPMVSYNHFTVPRWYAARGGFEAADGAEIFARFAGRVTAALGDLIPYAATFNEANIALLVRIMRRGRGAETIAAMLAAAAKASGSDIFSSVLFSDPDRINAGLYAAHKAAMQAIRAERSSITLGLLLTMQQVEGVGENNLAAAVQQALYGNWLAEADNCDFLGVQTYTRFRVGDKGALPIPEDAERTASGYEYRPQALGATIRLAAASTSRPIYVTESGIATDDDTRRVAFIDAALDEVRACLDEGIDVRSFIQWSMLDNFEWTAGYGQRFGMVDVDRATFKRMPKPSAYHLGAHARANRI
ncbi:MAG: family 1 glycosylhydrolase [Micropepsaceae bacterium]